MKILVFGATGMVGKYIIDIALSHGHEVRAFGRNVFDKLSTERTRLELFKGYLFTDKDISRSLKGADAVISALGGAADGIDRTRSLGMKKIVAEMNKRGPKRIIAIGGAGILDTKVSEDSDETTYIFKKPDFPKKYIPVSEEHFNAYARLKESNLEWTFVCPPDIIDAPATGEYNLNRDRVAEGKFEINAGDIAHFMVNELTNNAYLNCRVGIAAKD